MSGTSRKNEGTIDRIARILIGVILLSLVWVGPQTPWGFIGLLPLITGIIGWCPCYTVLKISTCRATGGEAETDKPGS